MTKREALIISAYTGITMVPFGELHEFAEARLGHPIWTSEFASPKINDQLKEAVREDFLAICAGVTDE